ncbi:MAG: site-specific integrase [Chlamydiota bacterium]|nr:site-specific integrase [Chlamydiota bacterium]
MTSRAKVLQGQLFKRDEKIGLLIHKFNEMLKATSLEDAVSFWKAELKETKEIRKETLSNYANSLQNLFEKGILPTKDAKGNPYSLDCFIWEQDKFLNAITENSSWTEHEKRIRVNALISFSKFLGKTSHGHFQSLDLPKQYILKDGRGEITPSTLTEKEWKSFIEELEKNSLRDSLIAKVMYYTARSLSQILDLKVDQIDFINRQVHFDSNSTSEIIRLDFGLIKLLQKYINESAPFRQDSPISLFITNQGKPVFRTHLAQIFERARKSAKLEFKVTAKMIQWSYVVHRLNDPNFSKRKLLEMLRIKKLPNNFEVQDK